LAPNVFWILLREIADMVFSLDLNA